MHKRWFAFYCDGGGAPEGRVDILRLDLAFRRFEVIGECERSGLCKGYHGENLEEVRLTREQFNALLAIARECFGKGSYTVGGPQPASAVQNGSQSAPAVRKGTPPREVVPKKRVFAAMRRTLSEEEIAQIVRSGTPERADYFDRVAMLSAVDCFLAGGMTSSAFADWCLLMMYCFQNGVYRGRQLIELYNELADSFDGMAFTSEDCTDEETRLRVLEFYAELKYAAHRRDCLLQKKKKPFQKNDIVVYAAFAFTAGFDREDGCCVYFFCVADHRRERVNYYQADDPVFDRELCYTLIESEEFERLTSRYVDFRLDRTLFAEAQKGN